MKILIPILIALSPLTVFGAWAAQTSFETTDGSTSPTDGNDLNGTGDGAGWSGNWTAGTQFDYDNGVAGIPGGSWVMNNLQPSSADVNATRVLSSTVVSGRVEFRFRSSSITQDNFGIQLMDGATRGQDMYFCSTTAGCGGSTGRAVTDNNGWILSDQVPVNTWVKVGVDFDCTTDTSNVYLDDVLIKTGALFLTPITSIDRVVFRNPGGAGTGGYPVNFYVDLIEDGTPASPTPERTDFPAVIRGAVLKGAVIR